MSDVIRFRMGDPGELHRLTFAPDRDPDFTRRLTDLLGAPLPTAGEPTRAGLLLIWQGPDDYLIAGLGDRRAALETAVAGRSALLGDAAAGLTAFDLAGGDLDARIGHERPHPGLASRVMRLAALRVTALWQDGDPSTMRLLVDRSYAAYVRQWLIERWRAVDEART